MGGLYPKSPESPLSGGTQAQRILKVYPNLIITSVPEYGIVVGCFRDWIGEISGHLRNGGVRDGSHLYGDNPSGVGNGIGWNRSVSLYSHRQIDSLADIRHIRYPSTVPSGTGEASEIQECDDSEDDKNGDNHQKFHKRKSCNPFLSSSRMRVFSLGESSFVTSANLGWIPAFVGMTGIFCFHVGGKSEKIGRIEEIKRKSLSFFFFFVFKFRFKNTKKRLYRNSRFKIDISKVE